MDGFMIETCKNPENSGGFGGTILFGNTIYVHLEATPVADHFHEMETPLKPAIQLPKEMVHDVFRAHTKKHTHSKKN